MSHSFSVIAAAIADCASTLQKRHGLLGRLTLTYDMTFLILVLSSLYEPEEQTGSARCPVHPLKKRGYWTSEFSSYAADLNLLLAWWNCLDDWMDEKRLSRLIMYKCLSRRCKKLELQYPRQSKAIREKFKKLHRYETGPGVSADQAANCFGDLMGRIIRGQRRRILVSYSAPNGTRFGDVSSILWMLVSMPVTMKKKDTPTHYWP